MNLEGVMVGDMLYIVRGQRRQEPYEAPVTKVGRKWVTVSCGHREAQFALEDGRQNYDVAPDTAYPSRSAYEAERLTDEAWRRLQRAVAASNPKRANLSAVQIDEISTRLEGKP